MDFRMKQVCHKVCLSLTVLIMFSSLIGKEQIIINQWLRTNPLDISTPAFTQTSNTKKDNWNSSDFLDFQYLDLDQVKPEARQEFSWNQKTRNWVVSDTLNNEIPLLFTKDEQYETEYLATYIQTDRWVKGEFEIKTSLPVKIWMDGKLLLKKSSLDSLYEEPTAKSQPIHLTNGTHKLLLKIIKPREYSKKGSISTKIQLKNKYKSALRNSISPTSHMNIDKLIHTPNIVDVAISSDGNYFSVTKSKYDSSGEKNRWVEIRNYANGALYQSLKGDEDIDNLQWSPQGHTFSYITKEKNKSTLWITDIDKGISRKLIQEVKNLKKYRWAQKGESILYTLSKKVSQNKNKVKRLKNLAQRQPSNRSKNYLYKINVNSGNKVRLTGGELSTSLAGISPDGNSIIVSRKHTGEPQRPHYSYSYYLLNLNSMEWDSLFNCRWLQSIHWSPDGEQLLLTGGPSMFDGLGKNLPDTLPPNEYDIQAYLYNLSNEQIRPISKSFSPSIKGAQWLNKKKILFLAHDRSKIKLFQYNPNKNNYREISSNISSIEDFDFAHNNDQRGIYYGSSAASPTQINKLTFGWGDKNETLIKPLQKHFENTDFGRVKRWTFNNDKGIEIEGRVYYPPNFDKSKKYPCIVYYYGGTMPVPPQFKGLYPKNYWAANGYIVYVLQPSGAIGFGQEFSSQHINEWGTQVPQEITQGVNKLVQSHSFIDKDNIGCIGASYGGFTTEKLISQTDIFSAAVSHAGISSIPGYWGTGYWGFEYSSIVSPEKYPWKDTEFFINNSPYFNADSIHTPLLLTHGKEDNNVPPEQSIQLYTALRMLDKKVELIQIEEQDHHITNPDYRKKWTKSITAWFDKHLKNQPEWWNHLYK